MSFFDDLEPRRETPKPKDLSVMGIEEIESYIAGLQAEISRARAAIDQKRAARQGADTFFKR
ncbi:DUF1192 domain-containing protein [Arenibaculum pallidiluteum]|uniref:DUF1192 domain-containing protein n=1 Tax=Arenibaculum pallidiluteum TaxID=2812559 RepID=UPI001A9639CC|nr:DUF1192 domain-containing protein [Arenibaculum pallidiluteum]